MTEDNFDRLVIREVGEKTWQIVENDHVAMYLLTGNKKALMIDTGWGIGNLPGALKTLTDLTVSAVITHGHPDHVCGAFNFNEIFISKDDKSSLEVFYKKEIRTKIIENRFKGPFPVDFSKEQWINKKIKKVEIIGEGYIFDLGDRRLGVISNPGHTAGSISLLDETNGYLFSGDSVKYDQILMHLDSSLNLSVYLESMKHLYSFRKSFQRIFPGHGGIIESNDILDEIITGVSDIENGELKGVPEETFFGPGIVAKLNRCSIVYKAERL